MSMSAGLRESLGADLIRELLTRTGPFPLPRDWPPGKYFPLARHIATSELAALLFVRRASVRRFASAIAICVATPTGWRVVHETSDTWLLPPSAGRPEHGPALAAIGRTSGTEIGPSDPPRSVTVTSGVVSRATQHLQIASSIGIQMLEVQPATGAFVALAAHAKREERAYRLIALSIDGSVADEHAFRDDPR